MAALTQARPAHTKLSDHNAFAVTHAVSSRNSAPGTCHSPQALFIVEAYFLTKPALNRRLDPSASRVIFATPALASAFGDLERNTEVALYNKVLFCLFI